MPRAGHFIRDLNELGCRFALDDFGAGSFYFLEHLAFEFLKIDGEFVKNWRTSETDRLLIKAASRRRRRDGQTYDRRVRRQRGTVRLLANLGVDYGQRFSSATPNRWSARNSREPRKALHAATSNSRSFGSRGRRNTSTIRRCRWLSLLRA